MKISPYEITDLIDDLCSEISRVVAVHASIADELKEDLIDQRNTDAQRAKIDRIKHELSRENDRLAQLRQRDQQKREIERKRKERDAKNVEDRRQTESTRTNPGMIPLRNQRGELLGWIQSMGTGRTILDRTGRVVGREVGGVTFDARGRVCGRRLGTLVLGRVVAAAP